MPFWLPKVTTLHLGRRLELQSVEVEDLRHR